MTCLLPKCAVDGADGRDRRLILHERQDSDPYLRYSLRTACDDVWLPSLCPSLLCQIELINRHARYGVPALPGAGVARFMFRKIV